MTFECLWICLILTNSFPSSVQCEEITYEERLYPAGKWACITKGEPKYEQSISMGFMKIIRYICKENSVGTCKQVLWQGYGSPQELGCWDWRSKGWVSKNPALPLFGMCCVRLYPGRHLGMTVPVINEIHLNKEGTELLPEVITAYYLPEEFQLNPPLPLDPEIQIVERAPLQAITRWAYLLARG